MKRVISLEDAQRLFTALLDRQRSSSKIEARSRRRLALFAWSALAVLAYLGPWWLSFAFALWLGWIAVSIKSDHDSWQRLQTERVGNLSHASKKKEEGTP